jgi:hypothetical protein
MNWTNGSIVSEYWTRCGIGMVSFSLELRLCPVSGAGPFNQRRYDRRQPFSLAERLDEAGLLTFG